MKSVGLCLFIAIFSTYAAELPEENVRWDDTVVQKINRLTNSIKSDHKQLAVDRKDLLEMNMQVLHAEDGSIAIYCSNVINSPSFRITQEEELDAAIDGCLQKNKLLNKKQKRIIDNLIFNYFTTYQRIIQNQQELKKLQEKYERYKKPALRHPTT